MKNVIDSFGRLTIPTHIRRMVGLETGALLKITAVNGAIMIEPAPVPIKLQRKGRFFVAAPLVPLLSLTQDAVEDTRTQILKEREEEAYGPKKKI